MYIFISANAIQACRYLYRKLYKSSIFSATDMLETFVQQDIGHI